MLKIRIRPSFYKKILGLADFRCEINLSFTRMKKLSKLSQECLQHKGLCCENRTPPFLLQKEISAFLSRGCSKDKLSRKGTCYSTEGLCPFFREPFCRIYPNRPVDCKTYPVSIGIENGQIVYVIDKKCPAVQKGMVTRRFINSAVRLWRKNLPPLEWIEDYQRNDKSENYDLISIEAYLNDCGVNTEDLI